ncbi:MAG: CDP-alcohol phosphatidyltransferase family protein [Pirellulales bacterium]
MSDRMNIAASSPRPVAPATRLSIAELERRCQKPDHRRIGNWMARRVARPAALRVTRVVLPLGVTAHQGTLLAWATALAAALAFGWGTPLGWLAGAALLQLWYLLDHVDGQLARFRGTASLDGTQLDYLMHHTVNLTIPASLGYGLMAAGGERHLLLAGFAWGAASLVLGLVHDARYKAFTQRLKRVRGELVVRGGGGAHPQATMPPPRSPLRLAVYAARKSCEVHVVMNVLALLAVVQVATADAALRCGTVYVAAMCLVSVTLAGAVVARSVRREEAEHEFAAWYRAPEGATLEWNDGWWTVCCEGTVAGAANDCCHGTAVGPGSS